ncbi:MAG: AMP-binding protein, partial [Alphaproteobacteria bacterium]
MQTAYDLVYMSAQRSPDHLALVDDRSPLQFTYAQLIEEIDAIAAGLWQRGVRPGMFVATILGNGIEHSVALLALSRIGAVPALLNLRLATPDLVKLTEQGELKGAIIHKQPELAAALAAALPANAPKLCAGGAVGTFEDFAACRGDAKILPPPPKPHPDAPAFIFYTSGTTGLPKGGIIPHRASEHRIIWLATQAGIRFGTHNRALGFMPLSHCVGFYGVFLVTLGFNGTFYVMTMFEPAACLDAIEKHKITFTFAVPTHYHAMTLAPNYSPAKVQSLQHVLYGAAPIEPALVNTMAAEWKATIR